MNPIRFLTATMLLAVIIAACSSPAAPYPGIPRQSADKADMEMPSVMVSPVPASESTVGSANLPTQERVIIQSASLTLIVSDTETALEEITSIVNGMGGYVANSSAHRDSGQLRASLAVRVPANRLEEAMTQLEALAVRVESRRTSSDDVTEEYTDLNARLKNLELTERELQELLTEIRENTKSAEDVLAVYNRLTQIREEIERIKGRINYLSQLSAMATVTLTLIPDALAQPVVEPGWRPEATLRNASRSLVSTLRFLADALIWVIVLILPVLLVALIPLAALLLILRAWSRRHGRRGQQ